MGAGIDAPYSQLQFGITSSLSGWAERSDDEEDLLSKLELQVRAYTRPIKNPIYEVRKPGCFSIRN